MKLIDTTPDHEQLPHEIVGGNEATKKFILAGNALFTVRNEQSGNRFTFKVKRATKNPNIYWVSVLCLPNNDADESYFYLGTFSLGRGYSHSPKSRITSEATSAKVAVWYFTKLFNNSLPAFIKTYHEGRCGRCGRVLTVPESIESGFGPECVHIMAKESMPKFHLN